MSSESTRAQVEKLASLARISIPEDRKDAIAAEFEGILGYIGQLDELQVGAAAPVAPPLHNVFREDVNPTETGTWTESIVAAFPAKAGNALSVKKIISVD